MRKFAATGSLLAVLLAVTAVPGATADRRTAAPPPACAGLVAQLAETLKKVVEPLGTSPPAPEKAAAPLGDALGLLTAFQGAKCLPLPPVTAPAADGSGFQGPELCLSRTMATFAGVFSVLTKIVPGAVKPDPTKLRVEVSALLKTMTETLADCGLPAPPGGMPTLPAQPA